MNLFILIPNALLKFNILNINEKDPLQHYEGGSHPKNSKFLVEFIYMYFNQSLSFS